MIVFEQGALDSLVLARQALDRAIEEYEQCRCAERLTLEEGPLYGTLDNIHTCVLEIECFQDISKATLAEWSESSKEEEIE